MSESEAVYAALEALQAKVKSKDVVYEYMHLTHCLTEVSKATVDFMDENFPGYAKAVSDAISRCEALAPTEGVA